MHGFKNHNYPTPGGGESAIPTSVDGPADCCASRSISTGKVQEWEESTSQHESSVMPAGKTDQSINAVREQLNKKPTGVTILRKGSNAGTVNQQSQQRSTSPVARHVSSREQLSARFPSPESSLKGPEVRSCYSQSPAATIEISDEEYDLRVEMIKKDLSLASLSPEECTDALRGPLREALETLDPLPPDTPAICSMSMELDTQSILGCIVSKGQLIGLVEDCLDTITTYQMTHNKQKSSSSMATSSLKPPNTKKSKPRPSEQMETEPMGDHDVSKTNSHGHHGRV